ncbi:hypothetical protein SS05631_b61740 (plasmid) [Sinorhizobium sp. CCBAU 05631]|nr:hypothetical protein SS05631_b61740 [Sinorhizobium sp. CCBAU 05631]
MTSTGIMPADPWPGPGSLSPEEFNVANRRSTSAHYSFNPKRT